MLSPFRRPEKVQEEIIDTHILPLLGLAEANRPPHLPEPIERAAPLAAPEVQAELSRILASPLFCKAYRASRLLRYLVEKAQAGAVRETNEYAIGIEVFARDAASYSTGEDPIVRVQVGRLRERLKCYYAGEGGRNPIRVRIPLGSYLPRFERAGSFSLAPRLAFRPLACITQAPPAPSFTQGLNEELGYRLHREFGDWLAALLPAGESSDQLHDRAISHVLEGAVRMEGERTRISVRLLDLVRHRVCWSEQFDHDSDLSIARQELLAAACCEALHRHFRKA